MNTSMIIDLSFTDYTFNVTARILPDVTVTEKSFSFLLNNELHISEIDCNGKKIDFKKVSEEQPEFQPVLQKIFFYSEENISDILVQYSGSVAFSFEKRTCWHNIITKDIKSLNWYSAWYPQETSIEINHDIVIMEDGKNYFLVKGIYDEDHNVWEYGDKGYDPYNIMAYRKESLKTISSPNMNIYFVDESIEEHAKKLEHVYRDILNFYNGNLFSRKVIPTLDVACASPAITVGGGYRRKDLMWCTSLGNNDLEAAWLLAHETAHIWCNGANCYSWEDWLNETTAEWAALLFALSKNNMALFDFIIKPKLEKYNILPTIKTPDGSRPEGVHEKGTVLFYRIYKSFGEEAVRSIVRTFTKLEFRDTASLLQKLYNDDQSKIADFIKNGIVSEP